MQMTGYIVYLDYGYIMFPHLSASTLSHIMKLTNMCDPSSHQLSISDDLIDQVAPDPWKTELHYWLDLRLKKYINMNTQGL
jgi:hypothetical protein